MKKIILAVLALALMAAPAFAGEEYMPDPLEETVTWVASSDSTKSPSVLDLMQLRKEAAYFGVQYRAYSAMGNVDVTKVELHCSNDNTNFAEPENQADFISSLSDENWHYDDMAIPPCRYLKFVSTTAAASATDTTITMYLYGW